MPMTKARATSFGLRDKTDKTMNLRFAPIVAVCLVAVPGSPSQAAPIDDIIPRRAGASACFTRTFDDIFLRQHPRQKVTFIAAWMKYEKSKTADELTLNFSLAIRRRGERDALFSQGSCEWKANANRDTSNNRLVATFPKDEGAVCLQSARPDVFELISAQEGGNLILDRGEKGTLMVYPDESLTMVKRTNRARQLHIVFDKDDRVFQLRRASARDCAFIEEAVTTPEPGVRRR
jgi:hypothetical protein